MAERRGQGGDLHMLVDLVAGGIHRADFDELGADFRDEAPSEVPPVVESSVSMPHSARMAAAAASARGPGR